MWVTGLLGLGLVLLPLGVVFFAVARVENPWDPFWLLSAVFVLLGLILLYLGAIAWVWPRML